MLKSWKHLRKNRAIEEKEYCVVGVPSSYVVHYLLQSLMDKRIKPWVNKKIIEYIGEEEPTLTDFICQKVMAQSQPQNILNDVAMVSTWKQCSLISK